MVAFNGTNEMASIGFELETAAMAAEPEAGATPEEMQTLVLDQVERQSTNCQILMLRKNLTSKSLL